MRLRKWFIAACGRGMVYAQDAACAGEKHTRFTEQADIRAGFRRYACIIARLPGEAGRECTGLDVGCGLCRYTSRKPRELVHRYEVRDNGEDTRRGDNQRDIACRERPDGDSRD